MVCVLSSLGVLEKQGLFIIVTGNKLSWLARGNDFRTMEVEIRTEEVEVLIGA